MPTFAAEPPDAVFTVEVVVHDPFVVSESAAGAVFASIPMMPMTQSPLLGFVPPVATDGVVEAPFDEFDVLGRTGVVVSTPEKIRA
jgi:hypothetical protein